MHFGATRNEDRLIVQSQLARPLGRVDPRQDLAA
jgi:hypothetical protein